MGAVHPRCPAALKQLASQRGLLVCLCGREVPPVALLQPHQKRERERERQILLVVEPMPPHAIPREEDLSAEDRAIMEACENDETWQTIKRMRGSAKEKFLTCLCVMIQEVVEDLACAARFRGWARRWGEDELDT